jgi:hypothetical protein
MPLPAMLRIQALASSHNRAHYTFMFKPAADAWVLQVVHQITAHAPFEITHVELKSQLPDPKKFASHLAGLANAAGAHPVLVLIGVDQNHGLVGCPAFEVGDWYQTLRSCYEYGEAPTLAYANILEMDEKTIAALVFESDNPPYVVGDSKQGGPRTVPWRYGSNTGVAGRRELLSILLRRKREPELEFMKAELRARKDVVQAHVDVFVYPAEPADEITIPLHRVDVSARDSNGTVQSLPLRVTLGPASGVSPAKVMDSILVIPTACKLQLLATSESTTELNLHSPVIELSFSFQPVRFLAPIRSAIELHRRDHPDFGGYWELEQHHTRPLHTHADDVREMERMAERFAPKFRIPWTSI